MSSHNDFSTSDSFDDCDITAFLEDLKFRNSHGTSSDQRSRANSTSSSASSLASSEMNKASPLKSSKLPSPQQRRHSSRSARKDRKRFSFHKSKSTSKVGSSACKNKADDFDPEAHLDLPFLDEYGRCPPSMLPAFDDHQQGSKGGVNNADVVKLMWMVPNSEIV